MKVKVRASASMPKFGIATERLDFGKIGYMTAKCEVRNYEQMTNKEYELVGITAEALAEAVAPELGGKEPTLENLWTAAKGAGIGYMFGPKGRALDLKPMAGQEVK